jgi:hypothetical protein
MATSTTYGWTEPDNTSFVKDGALAMRTLGNAIDTTVNKIENFQGIIVHPFLLMGA